MFKSTFVSICLTLIAPTAFASQAAINAAQPVGSASFSYFGLPLYSAVLYTENGQSYSPTLPFLLELNYKRGISQQQFTDATLSEMERIEGRLPDRDALQVKLQPCFKDVKVGDTFAASHKSPTQIDVFLNGQRTCRLNHPDISARFFAIWLSDKSRSPKLSRKLQGG